MTFEEAERQVQLARMKMSDARSWEADLQALHEKATRRYEAARIEYDASLKQLENVRAASAFDSLPDDYEAPH